MEIYISKGNYWLVLCLTYLSWLLDLMSSWIRACLLSESVSIILRVVLISPADFLSSRTKSTDTQTKI